MVEPDEGVPNGFGRGRLPALAPNCPRDLRSALAAAGPVASLAMVKMYPMPAFRKIAVVGAGNVGASTAAAVLARRSVEEIVLIDIRAELAAGVAADMRYGDVFASRPAMVRAGTADDLADCSVVVVPAGTKEKDVPGATDPTNSAGRLLLAEPNRGVYEQWAPAVADRAPDAVFLCVTDPPDPLADLAATLAPKLRVMSAGALVDTCRFRFHLAGAFDVNAHDVDCVVLGEHGRSAVQLWSQARIGGRAVADWAIERGFDLDDVAAGVREDVAFANINIIRGTGASQYGIGVAVAEIVNAVVQDEKRILPVGSRDNRFGVTLSLPSVVGRLGVERTIEPPMTNPERDALARSAHIIKQYGVRVGAQYD